MRTAMMTAMACFLGCGAPEARAAVIPGPPLPPAAPAGGPQLDASIPADDPAAYADVRDAADWRNPYLIVRADGVEILSGGTSRVVPADALAEALASLPGSAWPYGRVVAVQEQSIRSGDDDDAIRRSKEICEAELRGLGVAASWWPSA